MSNVLKSLLNPFRIPAVFPEEDEAPAAAPLRGMGAMLKSRIERAYETRKFQARVVW